jgi:signal transduction histidine kinase
MLGLIEALELYLAKLAKRFGKTIDLVFENNNIETIRTKDKYSIFRIVQNFITIAFEYSNAETIGVSILYMEPHVKIKFTSDTEFLLNKGSDEYHAIASRIDNYAGKLIESKNTFEIEISILKM